MRLTGAGSKALTVACITISLALVRGDFLLAAYMCSFFRSVVLLRRLVARNTFFGAYRCGTGLNDPCWLTDVPCRFPRVCQGNLARLSLPIESASHSLCYTSNKIPPPPLFRPFRGGICPAFRRASTA